MHRLWISELEFYPQRTRESPSPAAIIRGNSDRSGYCAGVAKAGLLKAHRAAHLCSRIPNDFLSDIALHNLQVLKLSKSVSILN